MSFPDKINFEIAFREVPESVVHIWNVLTNFLGGIDCLPSMFSVSQIAGHPEAMRSPEMLQLRPQEVAELIENRNLAGFQVYAGSHPRAISYIFTSAKSSGSQATCVLRLTI